MEESHEELREEPLSEVKKKLGFNPEGLSSDEVNSRLSQYGLNKVEEKRTHPILKFLTYFWGPIAWMIEIAMILSAIIGEWPDFFIILVLLLANATIGFWEENTAASAVAALKKSLAFKSEVKRDGKWSSLPADELVPGDLIRLSGGDIIPADARLLEGDPVEVDQAALTGESLPVTRKEGEAVFSGSILFQGETTALVYGTGVHTYFGKTMELVQEARTISHFQKAILKIGKNLILLAAFLVLGIVITSIFRGDSFLKTIQFSLILTIASIPVALPTVLSITMAIGTRLLAKKEAIVSRLISIEELAGMDTLCADKTGTLTQNKLALGEPYCVNDFSSDQVLFHAALASHDNPKDMIDVAILGSLKDKSVLNHYKQIHFQPFDPVHKRTEVTLQDKDGKTFKVTKGAVQVIFALLKNSDKTIQEAEKKIQEFAEHGYRSLAIAKSEKEGEWTLLGILSLFDAPREDAGATIATANEMGVEIKMVTGDQLSIAKETAKKLGLKDDIFDALQLEKEKDSSRLEGMIEKANGFAQVTPEHKYHIVEALQKKRHIVGMTGDGVNDAPALKKADCGIAVSNATDAARAAADIVLMKPGLSVIIDAIKESRKIFQRMNSYAIYRIAETLRILFFMTLAILVFNFYPLTAVMIIILALLNDGAILSIAYDNVRYQNKPEAWNMRIVLGIALALGTIGVASTFLLFYLGDEVFHLSRPVIQTLMYLKLSVAGHLTIFLTRTRGPFWSIRPARILLLAVFGTQLLATLIAVYGFLMSPIGWGWALFIWGYAIVWFLLNDRLKLIVYRMLDRSS